MVRKIKRPPSALKQRGRKGVMDDLPSPGPSPEEVMEEKEQNEAEKKAQLLLEKAANKILRRMKRNRPEQHRVLRSWYRRIVGSEGEEYRGIIADIAQELEQNESSVRETLKRAKGWFAARLEEEIEKL